MRTNIHLVARCLAKSLDTKTLAYVIDGLLCVEDDPNITDEECSAGQLLFDVLTDLCPNAVELAQGGMQEATPEQMEAEMRQSFGEIGVKS